MRKKTQKSSGQSSSPMACEGEMALKEYDAGKGGTLADKAFERIQNWTAILREGGRKGGGINQPQPVLGD
jgi:hypothetical protein